MPSNFLPKIKTRLIQLVVSIVLVAATPFILSYVNQSQIEKIAQINKSNTNNVPSSNYFRAKIVSIDKQQSTTDKETGNPTGFSFTEEKVTAVLESGDKKDQKIEIIRQITADTQNAMKLESGEEVIVTQFQGGKNEYYIVSKYRINGLVILILVFILGVVILTGIKGINAFLGLIFSLLVIVQFLIPAIVTGSDPLLITFVTSIVVLSISLPLGHGFNKRTLISLVSSIITISLSLFVSIFVVDLVKLTGTASEEAFSLQFLGIGGGGVNLKGLLLSGIVIGILGILDDVTTTQVITVEQISKADPKLGFKELFNRGLEVGHEHIISLVNTLGLAYTGTALPLLLVFSVSNKSPLWVNLNNELIVEEVVRALVGSFCLLLAVPIVNFLAARFLRQKETVKDFVPVTDSWLKFLKKGGTKTASKAHEDILKKQQNLLDEMPKIHHQAKKEIVSELDLGLGEHNLPLTRPDNSSSVENKKPNHKVAEPNKPQSLNPTEITLPKKQITVSSSEVEKMIPEKKPVKAKPKIARL